VAEPEYRLDVHYPMPMSEEKDAEIESVVGQRIGSSGGGITGRDLQFYFNCCDDRTAASERISAAGMMSVSVVRRDDLHARQHDVRRFI